MLHGGGIALCSITLGAQDAILCLQLIEAGIT
jgi:hypothetical protein